MSVDLLRWEIQHANPNLARQYLLDGCRSLTQALADHLPKDWIAYWISETYYNNGFHRPPTKVRASADIGIRSDFQRTRLYLSTPLITHVRIFCTLGEGWISRFAATYQFYSFSPDPTKEYLSAEDLVRAIRWFWTPRKSQHD